MPELDNFEEILKKFERLNRFQPNSIPKVLNRYIIFVCSFRAITYILRKLELPQTFFKKFQIQNTVKNYVYTELYDRKE